MSYPPNQPPIVPGPSQSPSWLPAAPQKPKRKPLPWILGGIAAVLLLCAGFAGIGAALDNGGNDKAAAATTQPLPQDKCGGGMCQTAGQQAGTAQETDGEPGESCATSQLGKHITAGGAQYTCGGPKPYRWLPDHTSTPAAAKPTIKGDDLVHVGEDVPAGTYRAVEAISGDCYWKKSKDAEGSDIIDNDIPSGGRPQVTLKAGQWFTSDGCPDWVKK